jgi:D-glycero-D-manno-heptose 1,7-bisphosphate phosphatase
LVDEAVRELDIDCSKSYVIGDRGADIEFAHQIGAKGILVLTGYGKGEWEYFRDQWKVKPDHVASNLYEAVQWILQRRGKRLKVKG